MVRACPQAASIGATRRLYRVAGPAIRQLVVGRTIYPIFRQTVKSNILAFVLLRRPIPETALFYVRRYLITSLMCSETP